MRVKPSFLEKRLDARYPERKQQMQPTQPTEPTQPTQEKKQGFFSNLIDRASKTVSSAAQHFTPEEQTKLRECKMIVRNKGVNKVTSIMGMGGKRRRRTKTHRRKTRKHKTRKHKTRKHKTRKHKTRKHKTRKHKTRKHKTRK